MVTEQPARKPGEALRAGGRPCPLCKKPSAAPYRPFCSKRCADIDLHRWLAGAYAIPATPAEDEDDGSAAPKPLPD